MGKNKPIFFLTYLHMHMYMSILSIKFRNIWKIIYLKLIPAGLPFGEVSNAKTELIASPTGQMANVESAILANYLSATALWQKFLHGSVWFLYPEYFSVRKPATGA